MLRPFPKVLLLTKSYGLGLKLALSHSLGCASIIGKCNQNLGNMKLTKIWRNCKWYNLLVLEGETVGFDPDAAILEAKHIKRNDDKDKQVRKLVEQKVSFSSSTLWNICGTRVGNSGVAIHAEWE